MSFRGTWTKKVNSTDRPTMYPNNKQEAGKRFRGVVMKGEEHAGRRFEGTLLAATHVNEDGVPVGLVFTDVVFLDGKREASVLPQSSFFADLEDVGQ